MSEQFIQDLNEYFSKKYVNFDLISSMPSYESITISMVLKNRNRIEEGEYAAKRCSLPPKCWARAVSIPPSDGR